MKVGKEFMFILVEEGLFWITILYALFWLAIGSYYSFPNAEDLSVTAVSRDLGILDGATSMLQGFDGRYTTNLLHGLNPLVVNWINGYKLMPLLSFFLLTFSVYFFLNSFIIKSFYKKIKISFLFSAIIFTCSPAVVNQFFWMISSFVYLYPWVFIFVWIGALIRFIKTKQRKWLVISVIVLYFSFGLNEMFLILNSFFVVIIYYYTRNENEIKKSLFVLFGFAFISILMFITSPGIILRFNSHQIDRISINNFDIFYYATINYFDFILELILNWQFPVSIIITYFLLSNNHFINLLILKKSNSLFISICLIVLAYLMTFSYYLPMGIEFVPYRVNSALVPIIFIAGILILHLIVTTFQLNFLSSIKTQCLFVLILFLSFLFGKNSENEIKMDYSSGKLAKFKFDIDQQMVQIYKSKSSIKCWKSVKIKSLNDYPKSIFSPPIPLPNREADYWNSAMEKYFGVDEVYLEGDTVRLTDIFQEKIL